MSNRDQAAVERLHETYQQMKAELGREHFFLLSCIRREMLWPISLLLLIPVSLYAILYLVISMTYPR